MTILRGAALLERITAVHPLERDRWVDDALGIEEAPPDEGLPRGGVPYLPAAVDEIAAAVREVPITERDVFVDLGAGIGRVVLLVHLLSGARAVGIEIQAPLVALARARAAALGAEGTEGANGAEFVQGDATATDLEGTVFFLYAPFNGPLMARAIERLEAVARRHPIAICAVGVQLRSVPWLTPHETSCPSLTIYRSK